MIPYILAAVGGYLIGDSLKGKQYAKGGKTKSNDLKYFEIYDDNTGKTLNIQAYSFEEAEEIASTIEFDDWMDGEEIVYQFKYAEGGMMAKSIQQLNAEREQKQSKLMQDCRLFWAFSNDQLREGIKKIQLQEGEKLVSIGAGGYLPKGNVDDFINGMEAITKEYKAAIKSNKLRVKLIDSKSNSILSNDYIVENNYKNDQ